MGQRSKIGVSQKKGPGREIKIGRDKGVLVLGVERLHCQWVRRESFAEQVVCKHRSEGGEEESHEDR